MKKILALCVLTVIIISASGCLSDIHINEGTTNVTVQKKFVDYSEKNSHYIIVTNKGVFEIDRPLLDTFNQYRNPDVVYSGITEGRTYQIHYYGFRIDWIYDYPIVTEAHEIANINNSG
jgi:hypothetical protein